ncbi:hypothetical protein PVAP13_3KG562200 [Panicum virgatum]|uniref:Uncharacterized protein n=1 Tax=Panicum virgatum TaxID=38727 RepID=A0A8T0V2Q6_PANVG|nr:hypothetical protein PVAP13_3KG562200 [Panicum virgatum]
MMMCWTELGSSEGYYWTEKQKVLELEGSSKNLQGIHI